MVGLEQNAEKLDSFAQLITELASKNYADILNFTRFWPPRVPNNYKGEYWEFRGPRSQESAGVVRLRAPSKPQRGCWAINFASNFAHVFHHFHTFLATRSST